MCSRCSPWGTTSRPSCTDRCCPSFPGCAPSRRMHTGTRRSQSRVVCPSWSLGGAGSYVDPVLNPGETIAPDPNDELAVPWHPVVRRHGQATKAFHTLTWQSWSSSPVNCVGRSMETFIFLFMTFFWFSLLPTNSSAVVGAYAGRNTSRSRRASYKADFCICVSWSVSMSARTPKAQSEEGFDLLEEHSLPLLFPSKLRVVAA
jgi:hypothetical protein